LEGSVRKAGERLRINVQLINVTDGYHPWSERFVKRLREESALTAPALWVHHADVLPHMGMPAFLAQTAAEYGLLDSIAAGFEAVQERLEVYLGPGNLRYVLIGALILIVLLLFRWRR
jgi:hypothetical protein